MAKHGSSDATGESSRTEIPSRHQHEDKVLLLLTLIIGAVVGLVIVAFILLTENLGARLYPAGGAAWRRLLVPIIGSLATGFLLYRYFPDARGSGIPQTKAALLLRDGYISFRTVLGKFGLCSVSLASGIALGREGPSVHVGAGIASTLGRRLGLSGASIKGLIPTGTSAALAAAFNTPISAVLFSLEEVMGDMHAPVLGSIVLASATSWIVLHLILGDEPLFHVPAYQLVHPAEFFFYALLGVLGGLVSVSFVKLLLWQRKHFLRAPASLRWILPVTGGVVVGILGWFFPAVLGVGYSIVGDALNGKLLVGSMALLVVLKVVATSTCYASGNAGGIFGPSLFIGAMMGGALGGVVHMLAPDYTGSVGAYALVGMGTAFAGIVRVPLTSVIMVFEITRDYSIVVPLMISNLISYYISSRLQKEPIYEALQHQDGIRLPSGASARESLLTVGFAYRQEVQLLSASEAVSGALASVDRERGAWPVIDESGFRGMVSLSQMESAMQAGLGSSPLSRLLPAEQPSPSVYLDDSLDSAMRWLADGRIPVLPVVSRSNSRELRGTISLRDVLAAYALGRTGTANTAAESDRRSIPVSLLAGVLTVLAGLAVLGGFLSYFYRAERTKRADEQYQAGLELSRSGRYPEAIERYRYALSISHKADHRLALAIALVKAERNNEAAVYLEEILRERPASGPANLGMAAVEAARGQPDRAIPYYQRAIVGSWPESEAQERVRARIEFVQYLGKVGRTAQSRAEALALASNLPDDSALQKQVGRLLIDRGLVDSAADLFKEALKTGPPDSSEYEGLGEAEFQRGEYRRARDAFRKALAIDQASEVSRRRIAISDEILALDPTRRGIGSRERYRRSQELLRGALTRLSACAPAENSRPVEMNEVVSAARVALSRTGNRFSPSDAAEENLTIAERLWAERLRRCAPPPEDDAFALLLRRLTAPSDSH